MDVAWAQRCDAQFAKFRPQSAKISTRKIRKKRRMKKNFFFLFHFDRTAEPHTNTDETTIETKKYVAIVFVPKKKKKFFFVCFTFVSLSDLICVWSASEMEDYDGRESEESQRKWKIGAKQSAKKKQKKISVSSVCCSPLGVRKSEEFRAKKEKLL